MASRVTRWFRPTPSGVIASMALAIALGGTSYAVVKLPPRSVGAVQLKNGAVTGAKIKDGAIDAAKIKDGAVDGSKIKSDAVDAGKLKPEAVGRSDLADDAVDASKVAADALSGADINESSLAQVPNAAHGTTSAAIDRVFYRTSAGTVPVVPPLPETNIRARASAFCDSGHQAIGGGAKLDNTIETFVVDSFPDAGGTVWTVDVDNQDHLSAHGFTVYAICVPAGGAG